MDDLVASRARATRTIGRCSSDARSWRQPGRPLENILIDCQNFNLNN